MGPTEEERGRGQSNRSPGSRSRRAVLVVFSGQLAGEGPVGEQVVVGRDPGAADIVLDQDGDVSRRHARFSPAGAGLTVEDLGSTNGTFVNGHRLDYAGSLNTGRSCRVGDA